MKRLAAIIFIIVAGMCFEALPVSAQDTCTTPPASGSAEIATNCAFGPAVEGAQGGDLVLGNNVTFTVIAGRTAVRNEGRKIIIPTGAKIIIQDTGSIKQGEICLTDADGDGYANSADPATQQFSPNCTGTLKARDHLAAVDGVILADCDDATSSATITTTCYPDADGDGYYSTSPNASSCVVSCAAGGMSATQGTDCNDDSNLVWASHAQCYTDVDKDTYTNGLASNTTCLNTASCATATAASLAGDGNTASAYQAGQLRDASNGTDCNDNDATKWVNLSCYTDADGDTYTVGAAGNICSGAACPSGYRATSSGADCNDANASIYNTIACYPDADNDTYYSSRIGSSFCGTTCAAAGQSASAGTDCCDSDANAYVGSTYYGTVPTACADNGGYDYDCDAESGDLQYPNGGSSANCDSNGSFCYWNPAGNAGWVGVVPACGASDNSYTSGGECGAYPTCVTTQWTAWVTQGCK